MHRAAKRFTLSLSALLLLSAQVQVGASSCLLSSAAAQAGAQVPTSVPRDSTKTGSDEPLRGPMPDPGVLPLEQSSAPVAASPSPTPSVQNAGNAYSSRGIINQVNDQQGILSSQSQGHHGILRRALGGAASDVGHATVALLGATILNQSPDLPPDDASKPEWPFNEPNRKALAYVNWADGTSAKMARLPDGSLQIIGSGKRYVLQPEGDGAFAMMGDYGSMASVTPRLDGGYTIIRADGRTSQVLPREGGGFNVVNSAGRITATILPGPGGKHMIRGSGMSDGFLN